jgi:hypothetical protein
MRNNESGKTTFLGTQRSKGSVLHIAGAGYGPHLGSLVDLKFALSNSST